jgi:hypothetical protein
MVGSTDGIGEGSSNGKLLGLRLGSADGLDVLGKSDLVGDQEATFDGVSFGLTEDIAVGSAEGKGLGPELGLCDGCGEGDGDIEGFREGVVEGE